MTVSSTVRAVARRVATWALIATVAAPFANGQTVITTPVVNPPESAAMPRVPTVEASAWMRAATARLVAGYCDNVLWSALENKGRGFAQAEIEAFLWHSPRARWEGRAILSGEVRRYADELPEAAGEQRWMARGEIAMVPATWLRVWLVPQGFYMDQVFDLSAEIGRRFVTKMKVKGASGAFHARFALPGGWEIEPSVQERGSDYLEFPEDYSETKTGVRLRWRSGERFEAGAAIYDHLRRYRDRVNYTAGGRPLVGTDLQFHQTTVEAHVAWTWDWRGRWRISTACLHLENRDHASGFFNYDQGRLRCDLAWESGRWRIDSDASAARYDYRTQTVGMGLVPPSRLRDDFSAGIAIEYTLSRKWKSITRYSWERSRTNELNASYRVNTVSSGVAWNY